MSAGQPPRLERIFQIYDPPLYFVTFCTARRKKILANEAVHRAFVGYGRRGEERGVALGRYVIMPEHIHLFVRGSHEFRLGIWMRGLKRAMSAVIRAL
ncbi:MAG: transposase [Chthoniobacterales bacterium]